MRLKKILYVWSSAEFSTWDVARGYRNALTRRGGVEVHDYKLSAHMKYHAKAMGDAADDVGLMARQASDCIPVYAMKHDVDLVFIVSGMALHPDAIWMLRRIGIPAAVLFTESPYNDEQQREFHAVYPEMLCFTTERTSAHHGWQYLPHAYDPHIHAPAPAEPEWDVLLIGTLWRERIALLERVNWTGIRAKFIGTWVAPPLPQDSPAGLHYEEGCVHNYEAPKYYGRAHICLNPYRDGDGAESLNPRAYELAACGAFQLSSFRAELRDVFGDGAVGVYAPETLDGEIRHWLADAEARRWCAAEAQRRVQAHTFDARLETLLGALERWPAATTAMVNAQPVGAR